MKRAYSTSASRVGSCSREIWRTDLTRFVRGLINGIGLLLCSWGVVQQATHSFAREGGATPQAVAGADRRRSRPACKGGVAPPSRLPFFVAGTRRWPQRCVRLPANSLWSDGPASGPTCGLASCTNGGPSGPSRDTWQRAELFVGE